MCVQLQDREDVAFFRAARNLSGYWEMDLSAHQAMTAMAAEKEAWLATFLPRRAGTLMRRRRRLKFLWFIF